MKNISLLVLSLLLFMTVGAFSDDYQEIGAGTYTSYYVPVYGYYDYGWSRTIYTQDELDSTPMEITGIAYNVRNNPNYTYNNLYVYITDTSDTGFASASYADTGTYTLVYSGDVTWSGSGWQTITFDNTYSYDGTGSIEVQWRNLDGDGASGYPYFYAHYQNNPYRAMYARANNSMPTYGYLYSYRPNTRIWYAVAGAPGAPSNPTPADGATDVSMTADLSWTNGADTDNVDVYFSTDESLVINKDASALVVNSQNVSTYDPGTMMGASIYYWRVVGKNSNLDLETDGPVWSFATELPPGVCQIGDGSYYDAHLPIEPYYGYTYSQTIYTAADFDEDSGGQRISKIWYNYQWAGGDDDSDDWTVYFATTTQTDLSTGWIDISNFTQVYSGDMDLELLSGTGWVEITLDLPFNYDPNVDGNLVIAVDENTPGYTNSMDEFFNDYSGGTYCSRYYYSDGTNPNPSSPPVGSSSYYYPNIRFEFEDIPTAASFSVSPSSHDFGIVYFDDSDSQTFVVSNIGAASGDILDVYLTGANVNQFAIGDLAPTPITVPAGGSTDFYIEYTPTIEGAVTCSLVVVDNVTDVTHYIPIDAEGFNATVTSFPYDEDFEDGGLLPDGWVQETSDDFDWTVKTGPTGTSGTGPSSAYGGSGYYLYTESSSPNYPNKTAILYTPTFDASSLSLPYLSFYYNMYGAAMGTLNVNITNDGGATWTNIWTLTGNQGDVWTEVILDISAYNSANFMIEFEGITGTSYTSDMAIDEVGIYEPTFGNIEGYVLEYGTGTPIYAADIEVETGSTVYTTTTATDGYYFIDNIVAEEYNVNVTHADYHDATDTAMIISGDTTVVDFALLWAEIDCTPATFSEVLDSNDSLYTSFIITNDGPAELTYSVGLEFLTKGGYDNNFSVDYSLIGAPPTAENSEAAPFNSESVFSKPQTDDPWDILFNFNGAAAGAPGIETDGTNIFTCLWNGSDFHKYEMDGTIVDTFTVSGVSNIRDMAYDGTYFYGSPASMQIYVMDLQNQTLINTISVTCSGVTGVRHIAFDPELDSGNGGFWIGNWSELGAIDMNGNQIYANITPSVTSLYGSAYDPWTDGGPYLWVFAQPASNAVFHQFDIASQTFTGVSHDCSDAPGFSAGISGGAATFIQDGKFILLANIQQDPNLIVGYELADTEMWLNVTSGGSGTVAASGGTATVNLLFDATGLADVVKTANINITHDGQPSGTYVIPVELTVNPASGVVDGYVTEVGTGTVISGALVELDGSIYTDTTDALGYYELTGVCPATYDMTVSHDDYRTVTADSVVVIDGVTTTVDFVMTWAEIAVTPTSITDTLDPDATSTHSLAISNAGPDTLNYTCGIELLTKLDASNPVEVSIPRFTGIVPRIDEATSAGIAPMPDRTQRDHSVYESGNTLSRGSIAYGVEALGNTMVSIDTDAPETLNVIYTTPWGSYAGAFGIGSNDHMYVCNNATFELMYVDVNDTDSYTVIGGTGISSYINGMACDKTTGAMYGLYNNTIYSVDLNSGAFTEIGPIGNTGGLMIGIAIDGDGNMWAHDLGLDAIWSIDKTTGVGTSVGSTGFNANYAQGMAYDPITDAVYLAAFNGSNFYYELRLVDTSTGATTLLGGQYYKEITVFDFPGSCAWVSLTSNTSGIVTTGGTVYVDVQLDASDLVNVTKTANILISHDGQGDSVTTVPVTLIVNQVTTPPGQPTDPFPADDAVDVEIETDLSWTKNYITDTFYIYVWDGSGYVVDGDTTSATSFDIPSDLAYSTDYSWRIDAQNAAGTTTGTEWAFTTEDDPTIVDFPYYQDFEGDFPPDDWELDSEGVGWSKSSYGYGYNGGYAAMHEDISGTQDDWMITPPVDLSSLTDPYMTFMQMDNWQSYYILHEVAISTDGETWVQLYSGMAPEDSYAEVYVDLSGYTDDTVFIGFHYEGNYADEWYVDDILIAGAPDTILISEPDAATVWTHFETDKMITWGSDGLQSTTVDVELYKNAVLVDTLFSGIDNDGSCSYAGPIPMSWDAGTDYQVRIIGDWGDEGWSADFTVAVSSGAEVITVSAPADTTVWEHYESGTTVTWDYPAWRNAGTSASITQANNEGSVRISSDEPLSGDVVTIDLYDDGVFVANYASSLSNTGSYIRLPGIVPSWGAGVDYQLKVYDEYGNYGWSDEFEISITDAINITIPSAVTEWTQGDENRPIMWDTTGLQSTTVDITVWKGTSQLATLVTGETNDGSWTYAGPVPMDWVVGSDYTIMIVDNYNDYGISADFSVTGAENITVTYPADGTVWNNYQTSTYCAWVNPDGGALYEDSVWIEVWKDGAYLCDYTDDWAPNKGRYKHKDPLPGPTTLPYSTNYQLKVLTDVGTYGMSDMFTISEGQEVIDVFKPDSGSVWTTGEAKVLVAWTYSTDLPLAGDSVYMELYQNGVYVDDVTSGYIGNWGFFKRGGTVPASWGTGTGYQVKVIDELDNWGWTEEFMISGGEEVIAVNNPDATTTWYHYSARSFVTWSYGTDTDEKGAGDEVSIFGSMEPLGGDSVFIEVYKGGVYVADYSPGWVQNTNFYKRSSYIPPAWGTGNDFQVYVEDDLGNYGWSAEFTISSKGEGDGGGVGVYELLPITPNPAAGTFSVNFSVPEMTFVNISIFDLTGRLITTPVDSEMSAGTYTEQVTDLPVGTYFCRMQAGEFVDTKQVVVIR